MPVKHEWGPPPLLVIILAGGKGARIGLGPKGKLPLGNTTMAKAAAGAVWSHVGSRLLGVIDRVMIADGDLAGATRAETAANALRGVSSYYQHVIIHDAARPLLRSGLVLDLYHQHRQYPDAVIVPALPVYDSILLDDRPDARSRVHRIQTPILAPVEVARHAFADHRISSITQNLPDGVEIRTVPGDPWNIKVTTPEEYCMARVLYTMRGAIA